MKRLLLAGLLLSSTLFGAQITQDTSLTVSTYNDTEFFGQSFTATGDEDMTSIDFAFDTNTTNGVNVRVYLGETVCNSSVVPTPGALQTTLGLSTVDTNPRSGYIPDLSSYYTTLTLSSPVTMINTQLYTVCVENVSGGTIALAAHTRNPYRTGRQYSKTSFNSLKDFGFRINVPSTAPTSVPIGPLGLLALLAGILGSGFMSLRAKS